MKRQLEMTMTMTGEAKELIVEAKAKRNVQKCKNLDDLFLRQFGNLLDFNEIVDWGENFDEKDVRFRCSADQFILCQFYELL